MVDEKPKAGPGDAAHAVVRSALGAIPVAGQAAVEAFNAIITPPLTKRREAWIDSIAQGLNDLEAKIEGFRVEALEHNPGFVTTVMHATQVALRSHQKEKLEALRNAALNSALSTSPSDDDIELMLLSCIDQLTPSHLRILKFLSEGVGWLPVGDKDADKRFPVGLRRVLGAQFPEMDKDFELHAQIVADLFTRHLVYSTYVTMPQTLQDGTIAFSFVNYNSQFITEIVKHRGTYGDESRKGYATFATPLGKSLVSLISSPLHNMG